ncbi:L7Ae/L30e/S12e/Gadd45 family ribosomal protein [Anoxynatronum sibiricum]|uniref:Ribosomal L7Ae/L30e/S12e/Gadd45 family protein n=1 Tax=Anoxynatronum sibiricum TaxID=210623 RepID=A0ABU9VQS4_9CLOT
MLGFAARAGKLISGETGSRIAVTKKKAKLMIMAEDAAATTQHEFMQLAERYQTPILKILTRQELGNTIGKSPRAIVVVVDPGFAIQIKKRAAE